MLTEPKRTNKIGVDCWKRGGGMEIKKFRLGDIVQMKKTHPCGSDRWEILRTGMDFRIKCLGCGRMVMLPRVKFEKSVRRVVGSVLDGENNEK